MTMRAFAELLDRLSLTASRNAKLVLVRDYLKATPDPDRGWALAALTGDLSFTAAKPALIRKAVELEYRYAEDTMPRGVLGLNAPMFKEYLLAFELTSVLLLVAVIGAVVLGKKSSNAR